MRRTSQSIEVPESLQKIFGKKRLKIPAPTTEILPLQNKLKPLLKRAWPDGSEKDISWFTVDLAALWEVSRVHIILVRKLLKMGDKLDRVELQQWSQDLDVNWSSNASGPLKTMKKVLPRLKASLYGYNRKRPRRKRKS